MLFPMLFVEHSSHSEFFRNCSGRGMKGRAGAVRGGRGRGRGAMRGRGAAT